MNTSGRPRFVGASTASSRRPIFAVDLVSNSDRMLLAHRRNLHQSSTLTHRLDAMDRKCRRGLHRMRQEIRQIYFEEQLPREFELLEVDARRRREERLTLEVGPLVTGRAVPAVTVNHYEEEEGEQVGETLEEQDAGGDSEAFPLVFSDDVGISEKAFGERGKGFVEVSGGSRESTSRAPVRKQSVSQGLSVPSRISGNSSALSLRRRSTFSRVGSTALGEEQEEEKPQKTPAEIMESVRQVYDRMPRGGHPVKTQYWRNLLPRNVAHLPPPKPPPSQIQEEVKERFEAILQRIQEKSRQDRETPRDAIDFDNNDKEIDFSDKKWKPYQILLDKNRTSMSRRPPSIAPSRISRHETASAISAIAIKELQPRMSFLNNRIINGDDNDDSDSMSFIFSRSLSQQTDRTSCKSRGARIHWSAMAEEGAGAKRLPSV